MPQQRQSLAPLFAGMGAAVVVLGVAFLLFTHRSATAPVASSPTSAPAVAATQDLLECLVCGKPVDPATTQFKLDYHGQRLYFDRQECLDAFVANPNRYGHLRIDVRWSALPSDAPSTVATDAPAAACSPASADSAAPASACSPADVDSGAPADASSSAEEPPAPPDDAATPPDVDSGSPACAPASSAPCADCTNAVQDPNPPPLHQPHHHHHDDQGGAPAAPPSGAPASGDECVPQPPCAH